MKALTILLLAALSLVASRRAFEGFRFTNDARLLYIDCRDCSHPTTATALTGTGAPTSILVYFDAGGRLIFGYDGRAVNGALLDGMTGIPGLTFSAGLPVTPRGGKPLLRCTVSGNIFVRCKKATEKP
jgi:hypothetical protein